VKIALRVQPYQGEIEPIVELYRKMGFGAVVVNEEDHTPRLGSLNHPPEFVILPVVTLDLEWGELAGIGVMRKLPENPMESLDVISVWQGVSLLRISDASQVSESLLNRMDVIEWVELGLEAVPWPPGQTGRPWLAVSDSPRGDVFDCPGQAWIEVWAKTNEAQSIIDALRTGSFYSTTGPRFLGIKLAGKNLKIELMEEGTVSLVDPRGNVLQRSTGRRHLMPVDAGCSWACLKLEDAEGRHAWTQPILF